MRNIFFYTAAALTLFSAAPAHAVYVDYVSNPDGTCREFTSTITVGGRLQQGVGTACQQGDSSWAIVSGPGTGTSFFDNGIPVAYPPNSYPVNNVYYSQPAQVQYVIQRERVYVPASRPIIITNSYGWNRPYYHNHYHGRPIRYDYHGRGRGNHYGHGRHDDRGQHGHR